MMKRLHCKIISILAILSLLCVPAASAAVTLDSVVTSTAVTLTVHCGAEYAGKNVVVEVFEPAGSLEALKSTSGKYDVTDAEKIDAALSCVYHGIADASGDLTFTFAPTGDKGKYAVRIGAEGMYTPVETYVEFVSDDDADQVLTSLVGNLSTDAVAKLFEKPENENVYKPYQILNLDESAYYAQYDHADEALKAAIHEYIRAGVAANTAIDAAGFAQLFDAAVLVEGANAADKTELIDYITENAAALGLTDRKEYKNIYQNTERFTAAVQEGFLTEISEADLSGKSVDDVADAICHSLLINVLSNTEAPGVLDGIILEFEDELAAAGADMAAYKASDKPLEACRTLIQKQPFASIGAFASELNKAVPAATSSLPSSSGSPSGGRTSVFYSDAGAAASSPSVSIPVASENENKAFYDIDGVEWAHEAINALKAAGIISGKAEGLFAPNDYVTREEFVKMLVLVLGLEASSGEVPDFADVTGDEWFAPYVYTAYSHGIVEGIGGSFGVGANITRQDMAVLCARALAYKGVSPEATRTGMSFTDEISSYAREAVETLWSAGLVNGISDTEFAPAAFATRAQAAKLLYEVFKAIQ